MLSPALTRRNKDRSKTAFGKNNNKRSTKTGKRTKADDTSQTESIELEQLKDKQRCSRSAKHMTSQPPGLGNWQEARKHETHDNPGDNDDNEWIDVEDDGGRDEPMEIVDHDDAEAILVYDIEGRPVEYHVDSSPPNTTLIGDALRQFYGDFFGLRFRYHRFQ